MARTCAGGHRAQWVGVEVSAKAIVLVNGIEQTPPEGTKVLPLLVSDEIADVMVGAGKATLSGCGAAVQIRTTDDGFAELIVTNGNLEQHE
jgi:hypothetical protein